MKGGLNFVFVALLGGLLWHGSGRAQEQGLRLVHQRDIQLPVEGSKLAFTPDGRHILAGHWERDDADPEIVATNEINLWDVQSGQAIRRTRVPQGFTAVTYSADGRYLATAYANGEIRLCEARGGKTIRSIKTGAQMIDYLCFSPDSLTLAAGTIETGGCGDGAGPLLLFNVQTGKARPSRYRGAFYGLNNLDQIFGRWFAVHPAMRQVAVCTADGILIRPVQAAGQRRLLPHSKDCTSVAISRDGRLVAGVSGNGALAVWDFAGGQRLAYIPKAIRCLWNAEIEFSPDGQLLSLSSAETNKIHLWRIQYPTPTNKPNSSPRLNPLQRYRRHDTTRLCGKKPSLRIQNPVARISKLLL